MVRMVVASLLARLRWNVAVVSVVQRLYCMDSCVSMDSCRGQAIGWIGKATLCVQSGSEPGGFIIGSTLSQRMGLLVTAHVGLRSASWWEWQCHQMGCYCGKFSCLCFVLNVCSNIGWWAVCHSSLTLLLLETNMYACVYTLYSVWSAMHLYVLLSYALQARHAQFPRHKWERDNASEPA